MSGERIELAVRLQPRVAYVHPGITPLRARELNLTLVTSALEAARVEYFVVRGMDDRTPVVGVPVSYRERALEALAARCAAEPGYLTSVVPAPPVRGVLAATTEPASWSRLRTAKVIRLVWFRTDPSHQLVFDTAYGCEVEFWQEDPKRRCLVCPRQNRMMRVVPIADRPTSAPGEMFTRLATGTRGVLSPVRTRPEFTHTLPEEIDFPIDAVYTWVDGLDPAWRRRRAEAARKVYHEEAASEARFINRDELRYSLRSLHQYAPWIRNIYIVADDQRPGWLETGQPNVRVVTHKEIFSDPSVLPTFNSHAIESQLHHIEGLAEHFLYFNDDMFLGQPLAPQTFFLANGQSKFFYSQSRVPLTPPGARDTPVDVACKNNRELIRSRFGRTITQTFQHVPYPLRRSVLDEIERAWPQAHRTTMSSPFRSLRDISVPSSLYHYYAFHTGRALPGFVRYGYIQLAVPDLAERLERALARRDWDVFCLNDAYSSETEIAAQNEVLRPFLEGYFPVSSPYEKP